MDDTFYKKLLPDLKNHNAFSLTISTEFLEK